MFNDSYYEYVKTLDLSRYDKRIKFKDVYKQLDISEYDLKFMMMSKRIDWIIAERTLTSKLVERNRYYIDSKAYYEYLVEYQKKKLELITNLVGIKEQEERLKRINEDIKIKTKIPNTFEEKDLRIEVIE